ncbi:MAG: pilus assembly protein [Candidatus Eremiobacteraeota bacterium]|nr:pilus assembly protein [Candidatus Eremiobacteraeota bacterium]
MILRDDRGSALAEMAVITPLLLFLLAGVVELGRFSAYGLTVAGAARAGVQYGAQNSATATDTTGMQNAATADASGITGITATASQFCQCADGSASTCLASDCASSHRIVYVQVQVTGAYTSVLRYPGIQSSFPIHATAVMRVPQ